MLLNFTFAFPIVKEWQCAVQALRAAGPSQWRAYVDDQIRRGHAAWDRLSIDPKVYALMRQSPDAATQRQWQEDERLLKRLIAEPIPHVGESMLSLASGGKECP